MLWGRYLGGQLHRWPLDAAAATPVTASSAFLSDQPQLTFPPSFCSPSPYSGRRKWQPIPGFLPGESHGQRSLAGYSPWECKESDTTERLKQYRIDKAMVFPVVTYGCESCTIKKAERQRIDAFELWCWRRLLRVPWTARRSNQSILKEISPEYSLEGLMVKLKFQYFSHLMRRTTHWKRP